MRKLPHTACPGPGILLLGLLIGLGSAAAGFAQQPAAVAASTNTPPATEPLTNITFVALDTETTGLSTKTARVIEIAAVRFRNGSIVESRSWLINPGMPIPAAATQVHGITDEMVAKSPAFKEVFPEFAEFTRGAVLVAHNARFDTAILKAELLRNGIEPPPNPAFDTLDLSRKWYPEIKDHSLASLVTHLGIPPKGHHRALVDTQSLAAIFMASLTRFLPNGTLADLEKSTTKVYALR